MRDFGILVGGPRDGCVVHETQKDAIHVRYTDEDGRTIFLNYIRGPVLENGETVYEYENYESLAAGHDATRVVD